MRKPFSTCGIVAIALAAGSGISVPALAHSTGALGGFSSGLQHPVLGPDHLLAMLAVGIWGAQMGGRSIWELPVAFPMMMAVGGLIGMSGIYVPNVELGIAISVLVLGASIALAWRPFEIVSLAIIAAFAFFHGYAHGVELPAAADPAAYAAGFVIATGLIHVVGIGIGLLTGRFAKGRLSRGLGAAVACVGVYFLVM
jgi:urease accessory protein